MPMAGFICDAEELPVTVEACLACARSGALPGCQQTAPVIAGIVRGLRPDDPAALLNFVIPPAIQSKHAGKNLSEVSAQVLEWYATKMAVTTPESQVLKDKAAALLARQLQPA